MQHVITNIQNIPAIAVSRPRDALSTGQRMQRRAGLGVRRPRRGVTCPEPGGAHAQHVSAAIRAAPRATTGALGALVPFLAALILSQVGCNQFFGLDETNLARTNYYTCDFGCSQRVTVELGATVFTLPGDGSVLYDVPKGSVGTILDGPVDRDVNGTLVTWWQVQFDGRPPLPPGRGWVRQELLTVANETLVTKEAQVCLPAQFNPYLGGSLDPTFGDLQALCEGDAADVAQADVNEKLAPLGRFLCQGSPGTAILAKNYDASCNSPCPDGEDVCLVAGTDPPDPTPEPLSAALFQPTSVCEVTGGVELFVDGHAPKTQPTAQGVLEIRGRPCPRLPGEECRVSMSYRLTGDDIEFDSGTVFASDPKFIDLGLSGATEPDVINLGELLPDFYLGEVPAGTAFSSGQVTRLFFGLLEITYAVHGRNAEGIALAMNWTTKACRVGGQLVGNVIGDGDEGTLDAQVDMALDGVIVNQPPWPDAGPNQTVECISPAGAAVTLDASVSTDADDNISFYVWRHGSAAGSQITAPSSNPVAQTSQALGEETYYLQVVDSRFAADDDAVRVSVVDTTAPTISCNAPATITPSDVQDGISFTATATDVCSGVSRVAVTGFACARPESCKVTFAGDTITVLDSGGIGDVISWTVSATDGTDNAGQKTCQIEVIKKK